MTTIHAFPNDWSVSRVLYTGAALVAAGAMIAGAAAFIADGARNTSRPGPTPTAPTTYLAPHCERASAAGTEDCRWEPVADCLSDEDGDAAIPDGFVGCRWDAQTAGNREGTSYVIWRRN